MNSDSAPTGEDFMVRNLNSVNSVCRLNMSVLADLLQAFHYLGLCVLVGSRAEAKGRLRASVQDADIHDTNAASGFCLL